jgi:hypothetical protein
MSPRVDEVQAKAETLSDSANQLLSIIDTLFTCFDKHCALSRGVKKPKVRK